MRKFIFTSLVVILVLSSFSMFGFVFMDHTAQYSCPFSVASGNNCADISDMFSLAIHHISSIRMFTEVTVVNNASIALIVLFAIAIFWFIKLEDHSINLVSKILRISFKFASHPVFARILKWIALRNKLDIYSYAKASSDFRP